MSSIILSLLLACESMKQSNKECVDCDTSLEDTGYTQTEDTSDTDDTTNDSGDTDVIDTGDTITNVMKMETVSQLTMAIVMTIIQMQTQMSQKLAMVSITIVMALSMRPAQQMH